MKAHLGVARSARWRMLFGAVVACGGVLAPPASAATFSARETHRGLVVDRADGTKDRLMSTGWFRRSGKPMLVYHDGGGKTAAVWETTPGAAIVRSGTSDKAPVIGRIVPSWDDNALRLTIEPAGGAAIHTSVFARESGGGSETLERAASTREDLEGTYRASLRSAGGGDAGWLSVDVDPEGATSFKGDLPSTIPPALAAAAAATIDGEVAFIYSDVIDVSPLRR